MNIKMLVMLTFCYNLISPALGCDNFKELNAEADSIVNRIIGNIATDREYLLSHLSHLRVRDSLLEVSKEQVLSDLDEKYADFQQLYLDSIQSSIPSLLPFAQLCKAIYEDSHIEKQKTKVAVHLLFREVFKKLQDITKIMRRSEMREKEFEERRKAIDLDKALEYFFNVHESLDSAQGFKFPSTWGQNFSFLDSAMDSTHIH